MSTYQQKLTYFKNRQPNFLINIIIGKEQYELQTTKKHKVSSIIQRYSKNGFISMKQGDKVHAMIQGSQIDPNVTIGELQALLKDKNNKQITLELVKVEAHVQKKQQNQKAIQNQTKITAVQKMGPNRISQPKMVELICQSEVKPFQLNNSNASKQPAITSKQLQLLITAIEGNSGPNNTEQRYKQFNDILQKKISVLKLDNIKMMIDKQLKENSFQSLPNLSPDERKIEQLLEPYKFNLISYGHMKEFINFLSQKVKKASITFSIAASPKTTKAKSGIIHNFGLKEQQILDLTNQLIENLKKHEEQKQYQQKQQKEHGENIEKIKNYAKQINQYAQQIKKLNQQIENLKKKLTETSLPYLYLQQNQFTHNVMTNYINRKTYFNEVSYLMQTIQNYERTSIKQFEPILTLKKGQIPFQVMTSFMESLTLKNVRVLIMIGTQGGGFMGVYSTLGVNKLDIKSAGKKLKIENQRSSDLNKCEEGPGFFIEMNKKKVYFSTNNQTQLISYDEKFLYLAYCFQIMGNMKRKIQFQFKQLKRKQLKDHDDELKTMFPKKKLQITHLQILRVFLNKPKPYKKEVERSIQSTNATNFLQSC